MTNKVSISIPDDVYMLLTILMDERKSKRSKVIQDALEFLAEYQHGWKIVPSKIEKVQ